MDYQKSLPPPEFFRGNTMSSINDENIDEIEIILPLPNTFLENSAADHPTDTSTEQNGNTPPADDTNNDVDPHNNPPPPKTNPKFPSPPKNPPPAASEDTLDTETDWLANLETVVSEAYILVEDCNRAADQDESQYRDTVADLHEILQLTATELLKIDCTAPPTLFQKAVKVRVALIRHASKAAAEVKHRQLQQRVKELNIAKQEAALQTPSPSASSQPTPTELAAAAAEEEKRRQAEAQYAAELAAWQAKYDEAVIQYQKVCDTYAARRDTLAEIVFEGKGRFFDNKDILPEFVLVCIDKYNEAHRYDDAIPTDPTPTKETPTPLMQVQLPPVKTPSKSTPILLNKSVDSAMAESSRVKTVQIIPTGIPLRDTQPVSTDTHPQTSDPTKIVAIRKNRYFSTKRRTTRQKTTCRNRF